MKHNLQPPTHTNTDTTQKSFEDKTLSAQMSDHVTTTNTNKHTQKTLQNLHINMEYNIFCQKTNCICQRNINR